MPIHEEILRSSTFADIEKQTNEAITQHNWVFHWLEIFHISANDFGLGPKFTFQIARKK